MAIWLCTVDTSSVHIQNITCINVETICEKIFNTYFCHSNGHSCKIYIYIYILPLNWFFGNVNIRSLIQPY